MEPRGSLDQPSHYRPGFTIVDNEQGVSLRVERRKTVAYDSLGAAGLGQRPRFRGRRAGLASRTHPPSCRHSGSGAAHAAQAAQAPMAPAAATGTAGGG